MSALNNPFRFLFIIWRFTRPHTFIGSVVSVTCLYFMAFHASGNVQPKFGLLLATLLSALGCNLFITGLNQWADVENDKINKPWLPIPAGELGRSEALVICLISLGVSLLTASLLSMYLFALVLLIALIGAAYSLPPLKFKKHHFGAALSIVLVRGILVNFGFFLFFYDQFTTRMAVTPGLILLSSIMVIFSIAIAWFKDIPDQSGDELFAIKTLTVTYSPRTAFIAGVSMVSFSLVITIVLSFSGWLFPAMKTLGWFQTGILLLFGLAAAKTKPADLPSIRKFYLFFWILFFLEYVVFPLSYVI